MDIDLPARVVVNERTGTVVMGSEVTISPVAVAHGGLTIEVQRNQEASQPGALSGGNTVVIRDANVNVEEADGEVVMLDGVTIGELAERMRVGSLDALTKLAAQYSRQGMAVILVQAMPQWAQHVPRDRPSE